MLSARLARVEDCNDGLPLVAVAVPVYGGSDARHAARGFSSGAAVKSTHDEETLVVSGGRRYSWIVEPVSIHVRQRDDRAARDVAELKSLRCGRVEGNDGVGARVERLFARITRRRNEPG